ncbi:GtrA family protein [Niveibacterium sp. 24ML]|uniref:GtrA family protein n=1 Tax=Niveibacterium sp. 24ML TaxID=2985512 RepID=UPI00226FA2C8|nr:GtrA family protein [Niveibacterium sp. 24ML]MCX9158360.1 GtrA family protein [Niveibacterium sp. 24ML]
MPEIKTLATATWSGWLGRERERFARFLVVGAVNAAFGYGIYAALVFFGVDYKAALFISTCAGVAFNFKTTGSFVFANRQPSRIFRFVGVYVVTYLVNAAGVGFLARFGMGAYLAGALLILPVAILAFLLNRNFVFNDA